MTTIPTALLIIAGLSVCLLMLAVLLILPYQVEDQLNIKYPHPKIGPCASQRCMIVLWVWFVPTLIAVAGWMIF